MLQLRANRNLSPFFSHSRWDLRRRSLVKRAEQRVLDLRGRTTCVKKCSAGLYIQEVLHQCFWRINRITFLVVYTRPCTAHPRRWQLELAPSWDSGCLDGALHSFFFLVTSSKKNRLPLPPTHPKGTCGTFQPTSWKRQGSVDRFNTNCSTLMNHNSTLHQKSLGKNGLSCWQVILETALPAIHL